VCLDEVFALLKRLRLHAMEEVRVVGAFAELHHDVLQLGGSGRDVRERLKSCCGRYAEGASEG
jgi:hypothetical protein